LKPFIEVHIFQEDINSKYLFQSFLPIMAVHNISKLYNKIFNFFLKVCVQLGGILVTHSTIITIPAFSKQMIYILLFSKLRSSGTQVVNILKHIARKIVMRFYVTVTVVFAHLLT